MMKMLDFKVRARSAVPLTTFVVVVSATTFVSAEARQIESPSPGEAFLSEAVVTRVGAKVVELDERSEIVLDIYVTKPGMASPPYVYSADGNGSMVIDASVVAVRGIIVTAVHEGVLIQLDIGRAVRHEGEYGPWFLASIPATELSSIELTMVIDRGTSSELYALATERIGHFKLERGEIASAMDTGFTGPAGDYWDPYTPYWHSDGQTTTTIAWKGGCDSETGQCWEGFAGANLYCSNWPPANSYGEYYCPADGPYQGDYGTSSYTGRTHGDVLAGQIKSTVYAGCYTAPGSDWYQTTVRMTEKLINTGTSYPSISDLSVDLYQNADQYTCNTGGSWIHHTFYRCETELTWFATGTHCSLANTLYDEEITAIMDGDYGYQFIVLQQILAGQNGAQYCYFNGLSESCVSGSGGGAFMNAQTQYLGLETYFIPVNPSPPPESGMP